MEGFNFSQIIFVIIAAIAGYLFGLMDGRVTNSIKKNMDERKHEKEEPKEQPVIVPQEIPTMGIHVDGEQSVRVKLHGETILPQAMSAEQRTQLVNLIVKIRPWIDAKTAPPSAAPAPTPMPPPTPTYSPASYSSSSNPQPASKLDPMRGARSILQNAIIPKKEDAVPSTSIVSMINDHLQRKLISSKFANMGISLKDGPMGAVMVYIGAQKYDGIDSVPDPEIQAIIKAAVAEWNASQ